MDRSDGRYMNEKLNLRSFYLRLLKKIWIIPLMVVIGAIIGAGIYTLVTVTFGPARQYSTVSQFDVKFAYDENTASYVDSYNAYTWNSFMSTDDITRVALKELSDGGRGDISKDELVASVKAEIPSDVRLLVLTVTNNDAAKTDAITDAMITALESYGKTRVEFDYISKLSRTEASLVTHTDRTVISAVFGAVLLGFMALFALLLLDALDSSIYVQEDCEKRYNLPVLGVTFDKEISKEKGEFFRNELSAAFKELVEGAGDVIFISSDSVEGAETSEKDLETFKSFLGGRHEESLGHVTAMGVPGNVLDNYRRIGTADGVILSIPYGKRNGAMTEHIISQLKKHDCKIIGIVLSRADYGFMKAYYGLK